MGCVYVLRIRECSKKISELVFIKKRGQRRHRNFLSFQKGGIKALYTPYHNESKFNVL